MFWKIQRNHITSILFLPKQNILSSGFWKGNKILMVFHKWGSWVGNGGNFPWIQLQYYFFFIEKMWLITISNLIKNNNFLLLNKQISKKDLIMKRFPFKFIHNYWIYFRNLHQKIVYIPQKILYLLHKWLRTSLWSQTQAYPTISSDQDKTKIWWKG